MAAAFPQPMGPQRSVRYEVENRSCCHLQHVGSLSGRHEWSAAKQLVSALLRFRNGTILPLQCSARRRADPIISPSPLGAQRTLVNQSTDQLLVDSKHSGCIAEAYVFP